MPNINEEQKKAFDFAADLTKQLITIATAIITLTVTFSKDILGGADSHRGLLLTTWILFILSIICGIWALMTLTGNLDPIQPVGGAKEPILTINSGNVRLAVIAQICTFLLALAFTIWYGFVGLKTKPAEPAKNTIIIREIQQGDHWIKTRDTISIPAKQ